MGFIMFAIDDAHFMDADSWDFVSTLGLDMNTLVVMTCRMPFPMCDTATRVLAQQTTCHMVLEGLEPQYLAHLACSLLGVVKIPRELEK